MLQLRRLLRALGLATIGLRPDLARRLTGARDSGLLLRFVEREKDKRALATSEPLECGEFLPLLLVVRGVRLCKFTYTQS